MRFKDFDFVNDVGGFGWWNIIVLDKPVDFLFYPCDVCGGDIIRHNPSFNDRMIEQNERISGDKDDVSHRQELDEEKCSDRPDETERENG